MTLLEQALAYAASGLSVFPCVPGSKRPACAHGVKDATTDPERIRAWWTDSPNSNIGADPSSIGCFVVDTDPPLGDQELFALELSEGSLPPTLTFKSPRGGKHYWFKGGIGNSTSRLGLNIDTRGAGGYVLMPPSQTGEGSYEIAHDGKPADSPDWIVGRLQRDLQPLRRETGVALDTETNVGRCRDLLRHLVLRDHVAVAGVGGNATTYEIACRLQTEGLSAAKAFRLLEDEWNPHCLPPWSADELAEIVQHAAEYMQNDPGADAMLPAAEIFADVLTRYATSNDGQPRFWAHNVAEQDAIPEPTWLLDKFLPAAGTVVMYGPPKHYKTFLALDLALTLATGQAGWGFPAREPVTVVYVVGEAAHNVMRLHRPAWQLHKGCAGAVPPFYVIDQMPSVGQDGAFQELVAGLQAQGVKPGLVVLDTVARAMRGRDENSAKDAGDFIEAMDMIQHVFGCTVLALHHTGKDAARGSRGSNVMVADPDTSIEVTADRPMKIASVYVREQRAAEIPDQPWIFQGSVMGRSLVFDPMDTAAYRLLVEDRDAFSSKKVGAAIAALGGPVSTHVLAGHMCPQMQGEDEDARARLVKGFEKKLRGEAKERLIAYTTGEGHSLKWLIPSG